MSSLFAAVSQWVVQHRRRTWLAGFAIFFMLMASWTFATPLTAAPDEPAHMLRAAAVARGQVSGPLVIRTQLIGGTPREESVTAVRLPQRYVSLNQMYPCYVFRHRSAGCAPAFGGSEQTVVTTTAAGRYNPAYYLAVGWPTLFLRGTAGLYAMRLLSALICAALLAGAVVTASEWRRRGVAVLGVTAAATPMVLFLGGVVNPNAVEAAAGVLLWTSVLTICMSPDPDLLNRRMARVGTAAAVLFCIRPLGLAWVAAAVACGLMVAERGTLRAVVKRRAFWLWSAMAGLFFVAGEVWNMTHPDHSYMNNPPSATSVAMSTFRNSYKFINQMVGDFGWLDTPSPAYTLIVWPAAVVFLALLAWTCCRRREGLPVLAICVGIFVIPIVGNALEHNLGPIWQGRYLLAFTVGLPILSAFIIARRDPLAPIQRRRLVSVMALVLATADFTAFFGALHQYLVGSNAPLIPRHAHWQPPGTWPLWAAVYLVTLAAQYLLVRSFVQTDAEPAVGGATPLGGQVSSTPATV